MAVSIAIGIKARAVFVDNIDNTVCVYFFMSTLARVLEITEIYRIVFFVFSSNNDTKADTGLFNVSHGGH